MAHPLPSRRRVTLSALAMALTLAAASAARAHDGDHHHGPAATLAALEIHAPFARATVPGQAGAAYLEIANRGGSDDTLVSASSPVAERVELHTHLEEGGMMVMRELEGGIVVPAGDTVTLAPGGLHLMLMGLSAPLAQGDSVTLELTFQQAGTITIEVPVLDRGATSDHSHSHSHSHSH